MKNLVVAGYGMVAQRFLEALTERSTDFNITVLGEESQPAYDRVRLSAWFDSYDAAELHLGGAPGAVVQRLGETVLAVDRDRRVVTTSAGEHPYDALVLATGSRAFVPPIAGADLPGCFVYRTLDDLARLKAWVEDDSTGGTRRVGAVLGGGLLGLEAANALRMMGVDTHVVEFAPRLMPLQIDEGGGALLKRHIEGLGVTVHTGRACAGLTGAADGPARVTQMTFADGGTLDVDVVVIATGIRPRDELAEPAGLRRGGARPVSWWTPAASPRTAASGRSASAPHCWTNGRLLRGGATRWPRWWRTG